MDLYKIVSQGALSLSQAWNDILGVITVSRKELWAKKGTKIFVFITCVKV